MILLLLAFLSQQVLPPGPSTIGITWQLRYGVAMGEEPKAWYYNVFAVLPLSFLLGYIYIGIRLGRPLPLSGDAILQFFVAGLILFLPCFILLMVRFYKKGAPSLGGTLFLAVLLLLGVGILEIPIAKLLDQIDPHDLVISSRRGSSRYHYYYTGGATAGRLVGFIQGQLMAVFLLGILIHQLIQQRKGILEGYSSVYQDRSGKEMPYSEDRICRIEALPEIPCVYPLPNSTGPLKIKVGPFPNSPGRYMILSYQTVWKDPYQKDKGLDIRAFHEEEKSYVHFIIRGKDGTFRGISSLNMS